MLKTRSSFTYERAWEDPGAGEQGVCTTAGRWKGLSPANESSRSTPTPNSQRTLSRSTLSILGVHDLRSPRRMKMAEVSLDSSATVLTAVGWELKIGSNPTLARGMSVSDDAD